MKSSDSLKTCRDSLAGIRLSRGVKAARVDLVSMRRDFHRHPELAFDEVRTAAIVSDCLRRWGYEVRDGIAGTGVSGYLEGVKRGKTVAIRADMDALPITERGNREYGSKTKGVMHACGHDGHVAIALQVARLISRYRGGLKGGVKFLFQPAEESPGGALPMIEAGVLDRPHVDFILALHLWNHLPVGRVGIRGGPMMASADILDMKVTGKGGHGGNPHRTVDSVLVAARIVDALQSIVSRSLNPVEPAVLSIGTISGEGSFNAIAEEVSMRGTTRAFSDEVRQRFPELIRKVAGGIARAHGARFRLDNTWGYPPLVNDYDVASIMRREAGMVVGEDSVIDPGLQMTAEDMSYFLKRVPGCFFFVGSHDPSSGHEISHHNPRFDFDENAMLVGAEILLRGVKALSSARQGR